MFMTEKEIQLFTGCYSLAGQRFWLDQHEIHYDVNALGHIALLRSLLDVVRQPNWRKKIFLSKADITPQSLLPRRGVGVYLLLQKGKVVYVGQTTNFFVRMAAHDKPGIDFDGVHFIPMPLECIATFEREYILRFDPKYNKSLTWKTKKKSGF